MGRVCVGLGRAGVHLARVCVGLGRRGVDLVFDGFLLGPAGVAVDLPGVHLASRRVRCVRLGVSCCIDYDLALSTDDVW